MASLRSHLLNALTRPLMRLIFRRAQPAALLRMKMVRLDQRRRAPLPPNITIEDHAAPRPGRWLRNRAATSKQVLLYVHGGAFIMRLEEGHTAMVARLAAAAGVSAFMTWYRLAPEHPFPAALDDVLDAYRHLLDSGHTPADIVVMGDSAGGNLALALLHAIRAARLPMPAGAAVLSPITDFAQISATWQLNTWRDPMYRVQGFVNPVEHYLQDRVSVLDPRVSPYYGELRGFPPLLFVVGSVEALLDDSIGMARKAIEAGVPAQVQIWQNMPHVFLLREFLPETAHARHELAVWLRARRASAYAATPLHDRCVELFDVKPCTGELRRCDNSTYQPPTAVVTAG